MKGGLGGMKKNSKKETIPNYIIIEKYIQKSEVDHARAIITWNDFNFAGLVQCILLHTSEISNLISVVHAPANTSTHC